MAEADDDAEPAEQADEDAEDAEPVNFADLLGPDVLIRRVDKDQKVLGHAKPEEMQHELMSRASTQKRLGACVDHVKDLNRAEKLDWALQMKDAANELYDKRQFEEAAKLYNDCLVAVDTEGPPEEVEVCRTKLQLPVCTNLAACMIEMNKLGPSIEMCDIALSIDPSSARALYRRGVARCRLGDHAAARPDFEAALASVRATRQAAPEADEQLAGVLADIEQRATVYLAGMRKTRQQEKQACKRMFSEQQASLYADRPDPKPEPEAPEEPIDDSDEAIDAALARASRSWGLCPCRRDHAKQD